MTTNDERREVAARLRSLDVHDWNDFMDEVDSLETAIGCSIGQDWQDQDWWHRLADLIDRPTCRNVSEHQDVFTCSECRCNVEIIGEECNEYGECFCVPFMPSFCPSCGMEIEK